MGPYANRQITKGIGESHPKAFLPRNPILEGGIKCVKKKNATRIGALALSLVMAIPMAVPAWAAGDNWIIASLDGEPVYNESYPDGKQVSDITLVDDLGVGVDVKVSVNG